MTLRRTGWRWIRFGTPYRYEDTTDIYWSYWCGFPTFSILDPNFGIQNYWSRHQPRVKLHFEHFAWKWKRLGAMVKQMVYRWCQFDDSMIPCLEGSYSLAFSLEAQGWNLADVDQRKHELDVETGQIFASHKGIYYDSTAATPRQPKPPMNQLTNAILQGLMWSDLVKKWCGQEA